MDIGKLMKVDSDVKSELGNLCRILNAREVASVVVLSDMSSATNFEWGTTSGCYGWNGGASGDDGSWFGTSLGKYEKQISIFPGYPWFDFQFLILPLLG